MPKKPINLRIDETLLGQLKSLAEENQTSLTSVIESFCQYGLQQDIEISKGNVSINVNTIDEEHLQQRIQEAVDTSVEAKVKTVEDRLNAAIAPVLTRLESLEQKTQPLSEQDFKTLKKAIKKKPEQEQSNEDASKMAIERSDNKSPQQEEKERLQDNFVGEPEPNAEEAVENRERLSSLNTKQLRELCQEYGLKWSHAHGKNKHLKKAEMIKAILKRLNC